MEILSEDTHSFLKQFTCKRHNTLTSTLLLYPDKVFPHDGGIGGGDGTGDGVGPGPTSVSGSCEHGVCGKVGRRVYFVDEPPWSILRRIKRR